MSTRSSGLTATQRKVARSLFISRPGVIPGTRVIVDDKARSDWYARVGEAMIANNVKDADVSEFCNIAGVPD